MSSSSDANPTPVFFNPRAIGRTMEEVSVDVIKTESHDVTSRWFHSEKDADLFLWHDERKNLIKQQVSFYGQIVEWNILEGVKTGCVLADGDETPSGSEVIHFDSSPQGAAVAMAMEVITHMVRLTDLERQLILRNFRESPRLSESNPEEFLRRYGRRPAEGQSAPATPWMRLRRWLRGLFKA